MSRIPKTLVIVIPIMIITAVFVQKSAEPKIITNHHNYEVFLGLWWVIILGLFIWLIVILSFPRIKVTFGGGVAYFASSESRDSPIDKGGYICGMIITMVNKGGRKLNLEPKLVLRDWGTGQSLCSTDLMPEEPLSRQISDAISGKKHLGLQPYCPKFIKLDSGETGKYSLYFFISKAIVDQLGRAKIHNTRNDLVFMERGLNIKFDCQNTGRGEYKCKLLRLH